MPSGIQSNGVTPLKKRKSPMKFLISTVIGIALFRSESVRQRINKLHMLLTNEVDYVVRSVVTQARMKRPSLLERLRKYAYSLKQKGKTL
ncbi:transposase domain-containing protein [Shewanella youngdeokensis]|uniref:transposase domain-containing protein n=1 Tax=Shewanella youngdeokensis TaxID=2999068 RepID=UPI004046A519